MLFFCPTCEPNLDEALELFTAKKINFCKLDLKDKLPDKQNQLESQLSTRGWKNCKFKQVE